MKMIRTCPAIAALALAGFAAPLPAADNYPVRPVRFLVPSPPAGSPDILARVISARLSEQLRQQVVVDNRAGASGILGVELAKRAAPDGYTLLFATATTFASLPRSSPTSPMTSSVISLRSPASRGSPT
jgi:tripartite-type tricarboxylate transporter receptor subunit TctC